MAEMVELQYPELAGKVAIVTGAASGMGKCFSEKLAANGAIVVMTDINEEGVRAAADAVIAAGGSVSVKECGVWDVINKPNYKFFDRGRAGITPEEQ